MKKKKNINKDADEENDKKIIKRTLRLEARVTEQEYAKAKELAKTCGLSMSNYVKSIQADRRAMYFSDTRFVERWMIAATQLINRWGQIENYLTE